MHGLVEQLHEIDGVQGWVVDSDDPERILTVELWAGTCRLAQTETGLERPDVCAFIGFSCQPGFRFGDHAARAIREVAAQGHNGDLYVRVRGGSRLDMLCVPRSLEMIRHSSGKGEQVGDHAGEQLYATLRHHAAEAGSLAWGVEADKPSTRIGYLEGIWTSRSGLIWLVGWLIDDGVADRPVIIVDTARVAAGVAFSLAPRPDLAADAKAFVAVMHADWQPDVDLLPQIVLAGQSGRYLEPVRPGLLTDSDAVLPIIRDTLGRASGPHRPAMLQLLAANRLPSADRRVTDRVQVDEVAVLPGFGAFVNGWALSPSKQARRFTLTVGDRALHADELSQARFTRPDLANLFPNIEQALPTAGFVTLCRGPITDVALNRLSLVVGWHDGSSTIVDVPSAAIRVLGLTSPLESICRFYPAAEAERFFADFAYHAARLTQEQASHVQAYEAHPERGSLLLAAPRQSADICRLFDQAAQHAHALPAAWGVTVIARADEHRGLVLTLFEQLQRASERPCSLFFTQGAAPTSDVIEEVAVALSSERIAWVAGNVSLAAAGWQAIAAAAGELTLLGVDDPAGAVALTPSLDAFVADLAQWRRLRAAAVPRIGGIQLPPQRQPIPVAPGAAVLLEPFHASPFTLKINEAIRRAFE